MTTRKMKNNKYVTAYSKKAHDLDEQNFNKALESNDKIDFSSFKRLVLHDICSNTNILETKSIGHIKLEDLHLALRSPQSCWTTLVEASELLMRISPHYYRLNNFYSNMALFCWGIDMYDIKPNANMETVKETYKVLANKLESMNLKHEFSKIMRYLPSQDIFCGLVADSATDFFIIRLDYRFCKLYQIQDGLYNFRINLNNINLSNLNITKFIFNFNEKFILDNIVDLTKNGNIEKLSDFKPASIDNCSSTIQKQLEGLKYNGDIDNNYGIYFGNIKLGYITLKYLSDVDYNEKKDNILKCINHTIITLYNASTVLEYTEDELKKIEKYNEVFNTCSKAFGCYELFHEKYKNIKLTVDLNDDRSNINLIFPSIKEKLFNLVICNNIKEAIINYDSDISRLQIKDVDLVKCYHLEGIDIVDCDIRNCNVKKCDIYDCEIEDSFINDCNLFGYCNCVESNFKNCFISNNIKLVNSNVFGALGKFAGIIDSGSIKNTTVIISMANIDDNVKKFNINKIN